MIPALELFLFTLSLWGKKKQKKQQSDWVMVEGGGDSTKKNGLITSLQKTESNKKDFLKKGIKKKSNYNSPIERSAGGKSRAL